MWAAVIALAQSPLIWTLVLIGLLVGVVSLGARWLHR